MIDSAMIRVEYTIDHGERGPYTACVAEVGLCGRSVSLSGPTDFMSPNAARAVAAALCEMADQSDRGERRGEGS